MESVSAHPLLLRLSCLALALLAGCAGTPDTSKPGVVVVREDTRTVWMTAEAEAAAKAAAAAEAEARRARARPSPAASAASAAVAPIPLVAPSSSKQGDAVAAELPADHTVQFDFDRFEVKETYWPLVDAYARWLAADRSRRIAVEGHADERGGAEYNLALGQRRAEAVRQRLELLGVEPAQAEAVSFGDTRPLDRSRTEEGFARNRRVELRPL